MNSAMRVLFLMMVCVLRPVVVDATESPRRQIDVVGGRALESSLRILEDAYGCVITYEDPPYSAAGTFREMFKGGLKIPVTSRIEFSYSPDEKPQAVIRRLVDQYNKEGGAELFRVLEYGFDPSIYNVVPVNERDTNGVVQPVQSILSPDVSYNVPATERTQDILDTIRGEVNRQGTQKLDYAGFMNRGIASRVPFGLVATSRKAQLCVDDLLSAYNASNGIKVSYSIRMDPSLVAPPHLTLHRVAIPGTNQYTMVVEEARPIAVALRILEQRLGCTITYESPALLCPCDVMRNRRGEPQMPSGDIVRCLYNSGDNPLDVINSLVKNSRLGAFRVVRSAPSVYTVFPSRSKNEKGELQEAHSLFTIPVPMPRSTQTVRDVLGRICRDLAAQTSVAVKLGQLPADVASQVVNTPGSANEPLHVALTARVKAIGKDLTWQLLYDPKDKSYSLNVYRIGDFSSLY